MSARTSAAPATTERPLVSVGMPTFNGERWIRQAVDSILGQTYDVLELVICDNASTDATERICREYADRDPRVRYFRNPDNIGMNNNYNLTFTRATGEYFKWASCSDICAPELLQSCVERLEAHPEEVLSYGRTRILRHDDDAGVRYDDDLEVSHDSPCIRLRRVLEQMALNNVMNGVIRSDILTRTVLLGDYFWSDIVLVAELALHGKFFEVPKDLFYRRMTAETATKLKSHGEFLAYYDARERPRTFQCWRMHWGHLAAASRAPLTMRQRSCVYGYLLRHLVWDRERLFKDLYVAARTLLGGRRIAQS
jgi:glycosyltransferase involved in cell wall biosynthesis